MKPLDSEQDGKMDAKTRRQRLRGLYKSMRLLSPISILVRVRDYYVRSINQCAGMSIYTGGAVAVPRSFPSNYSDDDFREIMRAASQRERAAARTENSQPFPRSFSTPTGQPYGYQLRVGRIDEESPCYFPASFKKAADEDLFPRSRSCNTVQNSNLHGRVKVKAI